MIPSVRSEPFILVLSPSDPLQSLDKSDHTLMFNAAFHPAPLQPIICGMWFSTITLSETHGAAEHAHKGNVSFDLKLQDLKIEIISASSRLQACRWDYHIPHWFQEGEEGICTCDAFSLYLQRWCLKQTHVYYRTNRDAGAQWVVWWKACDHLLILDEGVLVDGLDDVFEQDLGGESVAMVDDGLAVLTIPAVHCGAGKMEKRLHGEWNRWDRNSLQELSCNLSVCVCVTH